MASNADTGPTPKRRPRWYRWGIQILIIAAIFIAIQAWQKRDLLSSDIPAPAFSLRSLSGENVKLSDFRGKTVLIQFWATWCGVCKAEVPSVKSLYENLGSDQVLLAIATHDDPAAVRNFVQEEDIDYPVLLGSRRVIEDYQVNQLPTAYVVDPAGNIASRDVGWTSSYGYRRAPP